MSETKLLPEQRDAAEDFFARVELPPLYDHELDELAEMLQFALTPKQEAAEEMFEALHFYVAICGNTAARIGRESAQQAYELAAKALAKAGRA